MSRLGLVAYVATLVFVLIAMHLTMEDNLAHYKVQHPSTQQPSTKEHRNP